eukprot:840203_1
MSSMLVKPQQGPLLAVSMGMILAVFSGASPSISDMNQVGLGWIMTLSPARWAGESMISGELSPYNHIFQTAATVGRWSYGLDHYWLGFGMLLVLGTVFRVIAYISMVGLNRDKQR